MTLMQDQIKSVQRLKEFVIDARNKEFRLNDWEKNFLSTLTTMVSRGFGYNDLTVRQKDSYKKLEDKVYAS